MRSNGELDVKSVDDVINRVFEALSSPVRRRILEVLGNEGPLPFSEIMRRCGIRDSSTLKHHLEKLHPLVSKGRGGTYVVTRLGREALKVLESMREVVSEIIPYVRNPSPLVTIKASIRHYLALSAILLIITVTAGIARLDYVALASLLLCVLALITSAICRAKTIVVGRNSIIEVVNTPLKNSRRVLMSRLLGVESSTNLVLRILRLAKLSVIADTGGSIKTYSVGLVDARDATKYVDMINRLISSSDNQ